MCVGDSMSTLFINDFLYLSGIGTIDDIGQLVEIVEVLDTGWLDYATRKTGMIIQG